MIQAVYPNMKLFTIYYRDREEEKMPLRWVGYLKANSKEELKEVFLKDNPTFEVEEIEEMKNV